MKKTQSYCSLNDASKKTLMKFESKNTLKNLQDKLRKLEKQ